MIRRRALLAGGLALAACGSEPDAPPREVFTALHERAPDDVFEEHARLSPAADDPWGELGWTGWSAAAAEDGRRFAWCNQLGAKLLLPALGPGDRTLELEAWTGGTPLPAVVSLNGVEVGRIELATKPTLHRIETPGVLWKRGRNALTIDAEELRPIVDDLFGSVALAGVAYGVDRRPTVVPPRPPRLPAGTGVRYSLRPPPDTVLRVDGTADGKGALEVVFSRAGDEDPPLRVFAEDGRLAAELPVPAKGEGLLRVEARWAGDAGSSAEVALHLAAPSPPTRPPIVFVSIDTLAARHMSGYGYPRETTPNVDAFAADAIRFERCATNAPWTLPSYMSLMTGLFPFSSRMDLGDGGEGSPYLYRLAASRWTLAEDLRARGYRTAGFVDTLLLAEKFGLGQGFELYDTEAAVIPLEDPAGGIRHVVPRALAWLDGLEPDEPFFLFLHAYDVHGPYLPDEPWHGKFRDDELAQRDRDVFAGALTHTFGQIPDYIARGVVPEGDLPDTLRSAPIVSAYDEEILALDDALGELFDGLRERGLYDEAVVVLTADHGEATDEHDYFGHGLLYEEVVHIPLIVRLPGGEGSGRTIPDSVQTVDLYPTLLELTGLPGRPELLHGRSIAPLLRGESLPPVPTFCEGGIMRMASIEHEGWKLIEIEPAVEALPGTMLSNPHLPDGWIEEKAPQVKERPMTVGLMEELFRAHGAGFLEELRGALEGRVRELYYLPDDPREERDLSAERPEKVAELAALLNQAKAKRTAARGTADEGRVTLTEDDLQELAKLGYVDGD